MPGRGFDDRDASERGDSGSEVGRVLLHRTGVTFFAVLLQVLLFFTFEGVLLALARGLDTDTVYRLSTSVYTRSARSTGEDAACISRCAASTLARNRASSADGSS